MTKLTPIRETGGSRTGTLHDISYKKIVEKVGEPNVSDIDDPDKVKASWGFQDETGRKGFIWSYKYYGPIEECDYWSADGDADLMSEIFGPNYGDESRW